MCMRRCLVGLTFCTCYLASYLTNKYVLSVLKFTYPTLFQGWQTLIGGILLHASWKLGWAEINSSSRSDVLTWLPASLLFVGIIYAGSRALSRLAIPVFLTLHNVAEVIICGHQKCGFLGFFLMFSTVKLKSLMAPGQCAAWIFCAKVITAALSILLFDTILTRGTVGCLLLGGLGEALLVFSEQRGS
uniref:Transmembrane protein 241 n=1 Tax=Sus scrofa TaxID=9823 RepID=A0A8D2BQM1_PIG